VGGSNQLNRSISDVTSLRLNVPAARPRTAPAARLTYHSAEARVLAHEPGRERARRVLNVVVAVVGLLATLPVMAVIAALVRFTSRGPVFFRQTRVGLDRRGGRLPALHSRRLSDMGGCPFTIYKFRTMYTLPHNQDAEVWASPDDPRVTPVGRVLRKYRLDEVPQLWNVLLGDMNIVGPRPEQPTIFGSLRTQIEHYEVRQRVRPGITGWAQVNHNYDQSLDDVRRKVQLDLEYLGRQSVLEDIRIMALTVPVMVGRRGAW
jgi:lipopolysaccharide/colanic/teichoic acid biosynthesis glycosyltransferase